MAYTQVQTIADTDRRLVTKRINSANTETSALVVNAAALSSAKVTLTTASSANNFRVGETVNAASGGSAVVQDIINSTSVILVSVSGSFTDTTTITGATSGKVRTQAGSLAPQTYSLHVSRILYDITGNALSAVELLWEGQGGGANNRTIAILSGRGALELDTHGTRIPNNATSPTGNIILNTIQWGADAAYSLILDVSKVGGYAAPWMERNQELGY